MSLQEPEAATSLTDNGYCFGCGPNNPIGLRLTFAWDLETGDYTTRYVPRPEDQGWQDRVHGGLIALVFDEVLSRVVLVTEGSYSWVTAELTTRLKKPVAIGKPLAFRARIASRSPRLMISAGEAYTEAGEVVATATAKMMPVRPLRSRGLSRPMEDTESQEQERDAYRAPVDPAEPGEELESAAQTQADQELAVQQAAKASAPVVVFKALSQDEGEIVRGLLESEGIPAVLIDHSSPPLGDILIAGETHWGDVLVAPADVQRASELIQSAQNITIPDDIIYGSAPTDVTDINGA